MYNRKKIFSGAALIATILVILIASIPPAQAQPKFALATWDYPDAYGQGIDSFVLYSNSTGSWVVVDTWYYDDLYPAPDPVPWNASQAIKLRVRSIMNTTCLLYTSPSPRDRS